MKSARRMNDSELGAALAMNCVCLALVNSSKKFTAKAEELRGTAAGEIYLTIAEELFALQRDIESKLP